MIRQLLANRVGAAMAVGPTELVLGHGGREHEGTETVKDEWASCEVWLRVLASGGGAMSDVALALEVKPEGETNWYAWAQRLNTIPTAAGSQLTGDASRYAAIPLPLSRWRLVLLNHSIRTLTVSAMVVLNKLPTPYYR